MASSKAVLIILRLTCPKVPLPKDARLRHEADRPSGMLREYRQCRHSRNHGRLISLTPYLLLPRDLHRMSTSRLRPMVEFLRRHSRQKNGQATSRSRAGSTQSRKRLRRVVPRKPPSDRKQTERRLSRRTSDQKRQKSPTRRGRRSTRQLPMTLRKATRTQWTSTRLLHLYRTLEARIQIHKPRLRLLQVPQQMVQVLS
jgi:hypothetical protein